MLRFLLLLCLSHVGAHSAQSPTFTALTSLSAHMEQVCTLPMHVFHFAVKVLPGPQSILSKAWRADRSNEAVYKLRGLTYQSYAYYFLDLEGNLETLRGHCNNLSIRIYSQQISMVEHKLSLSIGKGKWVRHGCECLYYRRTIAWK